MLPFTHDQFLALFVQYNKEVWPAQIVAYVLGLAMIVLLFVPSRGRNRIIGFGLAAMWGWTGIVYHWHYFASINRAAELFAALFVLQAALFLFSGAIRGHERYRPSRGAHAWAGWALVLYAAVLYPLIGLWSGHSLEEVPMFGITPCPVTIFTLGMLLLARPVYWWLFAIPVLWSLVGGSAAFLLGVPQDWVLLVSGVAVLWIELRDRAHGHGALRLRH
jgi:hypothetical protein